jgi:Ca-activated chloride channel family protein
VHVFAGFGKAVEGSVRLKVSGGTDVTATISPANEIEVPRIAAARRMETATDAESLRLALDYQLLSRWTNFLVIAERADKAADLPELHQVPQMLAAGWGGTASVDCCVDLSSITSSARGAPMARAMAASGIDKYDIPAFLRRQSDDVMDSAPAKPRMRARLFSLGTNAHSEKLQPVGSMFDPSHRQGLPVAFIQAMERDLSTRTPMLPGTITALEYWGLDSSIADSLRQRVKEGHAESEVVAAFVYALTQSAIGDQFGRSIKRAILKGWKHVVPGQALDDDMKAALKDVTVDAWNWLPINHDVAVLP